MATLDPAAGATDLARFRAARPQLFGTPWRRSRTLLWIAAVVLLVAFGLWRIDADPRRFVEGVSRLAWLVVLMLPPSTGGVLPDLVRALLETLAMAFLGTVLATILAVPLGLLGARNIAPGWLLHFGLRRVFDGLRAVDTLIWGLIFVSAVGMGPFAGILALTVSDTGTLAKIFAEAFESIDERPVEGVRAAGASELKAIRLGILPQMFPVILSNALYFLESNTRSASILGIVGAGGIGLALSDRMRVNNWDEVAFILILILLAVALVDAFSRFARQQLIQSASYRA